MKQSIIRKFIKFIFGGCIGYAINLTVTIVLTDFFGIYYLLSYVAGLTASILFNFIFATQIIFKTKDNYRRRFTSYLLFTAIFFILNVTQVKIFTETLSFNYKVSIIFVTGYMLLVKYVIYDKIVFKVKINEPQNTRDSITQESI